MTGSFKLVDELTVTWRTMRASRRLYWRDCGRSLCMYSIVFTAVPPQTNNLLNNLGMESGAAN